MELIEREQQLKKLADAWSRVKTGKGCIALVRSACDDMFSPQPLGPFLDIALQIQSDLLQLIQSGADRLTISSQFFIYLQKNPTPVIMVLEDLHWAEVATLNKIKFSGAASSR